MPENNGEVKGEQLLVDIRAIDVDSRPASHMRVCLNKEAVEDYTEQLDEMPEVILVFDAQSNTYWVADGAHTIQAHYLAGREEVLATVIEGSFLDAWKVAGSSNRTHGVRITDADKRHRVQEALKLPAMADWPQQKIADWCGVTHQYVSKLDHRICNSGNSNTSGGLGKPGRPRKPKPTKPHTRKPEESKPALASEPNGQAESEQKSEPGKPSGQSSPTPVANPAAENEKAAERWGDRICDLLNVLSSLERAGGVKRLIEPWSLERRQQFAGQFRALIEQYQSIVIQIEEML